MLGLCVCVCVCGGMIWPSTEPEHNTGSYPVVNISDIIQLHAVPVCINTRAVVCECITRIYEYVPNRGTKSGYPYRTRTILDTIKKTAVWDCQPQTACMNSFICRCHACVLHCLQLFSSEDSHFIVSCDWWQNYKMINCSVEQLKMNSNHIHNH